MFLIASGPSIKAALEPVNISEKGCKVGSRFAVQTLGLDQSGAHRCIP
jgi:hypothetical protein